MKKIVYLGAKNIGLKCFEYLLKNKEELGIEIVGILTNKRGEKLKKLALSKSIKVLKDLGEYIGLNDVDFAISVQYHEILRPLHLQKANCYNVNLHMAPLPKYRGCNQFSFAIINEEKEFGTTLHLMDEGIDSGGKIFEKRFPIPHDIWVKELLDLTEKHSFEMFVENIKHIIDEKFEVLSEKSDSKDKYFYKRNDINKIKKVDLRWSKKKLERYIRATSMPGFSGPFVIVDGKMIKFEMTDI